MRTDLFDFDLPQNKIALRPAEPRDSARLMVVQSDGKLGHHAFRDLPSLLQSSDTLVLNDSKVIHARLRGSRAPRGEGLPGVEVELTLHKRLSPNCYLAFAQPARRLRAADALQFSGALQARVTARDGGQIELTFSLAGEALDIAIAHAGYMPLPPYIAKCRMPDSRDNRDYQTIYARKAGSVAAPTAGLHFTSELFASLDKAGIDRVMLTLHVGAGTFVPVKAEDTADHVMYAEHAVLDQKVASHLNAVRRKGGRIAAVGSTSLRTLESAADEHGAVHALNCDTDIFITPGYNFRAVDILVTNFHLPRSTLFMLVCAFMGLETMQRAYAEAIRQDYKFYSYGDACLLFRPT